MYKNFQIFKKKISIRLLVYVIVLGIIFISLVSLVKINNNYKSRVKSIDDNISFVQKSYLKLVAKNIYEFDKTGIKILLKSIVMLKGVSYCQVEAYDFTEDKFISAGDKNIKSDFTKVYEIKYKGLDNKVVDLGKITVVANYDQIKSDVIKQSIFEVIMNFILIIIVAFFILQLINLLMIKHLKIMSEYAKKFNFESLNIPLDLKRSNTEDEIGVIEKALNDMRERINNDFFKINATGKDLLRAKSFVKDIINSMPSVIIGVDINEKIILWNLEAEKVTSIKSDDALGSTINEVYPFISSEISKIKDVISKQIPVIGHKKTYKNIDVIKYFSVTIYPLMTNDTSGAVIRIDDITEIEKKNNLFRQTQKMEIVGTLAGGLAHDFNNLIGGIMGILSILEFKLKNNTNISNEELKNYIATMNQAGDRASNMVKQLLSLSRKQEILLVPIDLNTSIKNVINICKSSFDKSIHFKVEYSDIPAITEGDPTQIEQILLNLCLNASHAMTVMRGDAQKWGGNLSLTITEKIVDHIFCKTHPEAKEERYWVLSIVDNGVGMTTEIISKIFNPFFTTKGNGFGTGLGLAMVYNTLKQHNGFVNVYSEVGVGTKFDIYFPQAEKNQEDKQNHTKEDKFTRNNSIILVVDDEEIMRETATMILEEFGYRVILAKNGQEAIDIYTEKGNSIDVILLDMAMPGISGKETFIELKKINSKIKVILTSGYKHDERVESVLKLGVKKFIQKPYVLKTLLTAIEELV